MAEAAAPALLGPVLKKGGTKLSELLSYIWDYQTSITAFKSDSEKLRSRLSDVQREVDDARSNNRDIKLHVEKWIQHVTAKIKASDDFLDSLHPPPSCWSITCDCNCKRRYNAATTAETLSKEIKALLEECRFESGGVSFNPKPPPLSPTLAAGYVAMDSRGEYLERLKDSLTSMLVIGVYGEKGAGKTMLVKKLAVEIESSGEFNGVVLTSGQKATKEIQQDIAERIGLSLTLRSPQERARWLHDRLANIGKVVFVIDKVEKTIELNEIGIPWPDNNNGCRIVVVSRSLSVCEMMKTQMNLEVGPLCKDESIELFDELAKEYNFASASTTCKFQEGRDHISSKQAWLPGEIEMYIRALHKKPLQTAKLIVGLDRNGSKSFMLTADALQIEHGDKVQHWRFSLNPSTSSMEAKLIEVWFLHIEGKAREEWLWPATNYGAYLVYKLMPDARGFKAREVEFIVSGSYKSCYLDPSIAANLQERKAIGECDVPKKREDEWLEIEMGRFYNDGYSHPEVDLIAKDHNTAVAKSGLCVQGIELRPLDGA